MFDGRDCWIFDLDGTLTVPNIDFDRLRSELGIPAGALILEHLATLPAAEASPLHARLAELERELACEVEAQEGCRELLEQLARDGRRLGILTRNTRANALLSLDRLGVADLFRPRDVLGRDEAAPKPDPDGILALLARWGSRPEQGVMVGDFRLDLEAGRNAGVRTVHFAHAGSGPWPELTDLTVDSLHALRAALAPGGPGG
ncbi:MAG: HAD family hydrolase [Pseudomonadales bacterium]|jgi:HAD superfamily hydrolase (TIGR01509 family)|nr:HAD family hydrolase [Pseudomonadales bacterium]